MSKLVYYNAYKGTFEFENYCKQYRVIPKGKHFKTSFILVAHNLEMERGRQDNIPREQSFCKSCNMKHPEL